MQCSLYSHQQRAEYTVLTYIVRMQQTDEGMGITHYLGTHAACHVLLHL